MLRFISCESSGGKVVGGMMGGAFLRLAYLTGANSFAALRLLPMTDREKGAEILVLRHQIVVLERQLAGKRVRFTAADRALLAALLHRLLPECCGGCGCWCGRTQYRAGTGT